EFIGVLSDYIEMQVSKRSWYEIVPKPGASGSNNKRQKLNTGEIVKQTESTTEKEKKYYPYPADYKSYPTVG
ncbi:hypothetical protein, partial [Campylobacter ornithocola]|uniref:hypothetical protein n=1 Tax=Campylobacter ornithocola TaxID=1848766 RepID=UPI001ADF9437